MIHDLPSSDWLLHRSIKPTTIIFFVDGDSSSSIASAVSVEAATG